MRDSSSINELIVLSNAESMNAELMHQGLDKKARFQRIQDMAHRQLRALDGKDFMRSIKKTSNDVYLISDKNDQ